MVNTATKPIFSNWCRNSIITSGHDCSVTSMAFNDLCLIDNPQADNHVM